MKVTLFDRSSLLVEDCEGRTSFFVVRHCFSRFSIALYLFILSLGVRAINRKGVKDYVLPEKERNDG